MTDIKMNEYKLKLRELVEAKNHHQTHPNSSLYHQGQLAVDLEVFGSKLGMPVFDIDRDYVFPRLS